VRKKVNKKTEKRCQNGEQKSEQKIQQSVTLVQSGDRLVSKKLQILHVFSCILSPNRCKSTPQTPFLLQKSTFHLKISQNFDENLKFNNFVL
jgi:hypothetical protein